MWCMYLFLFMSVLISRKIINHAILQIAGHYKSVSSVSSTREGHWILLHSSANNLFPFALASPQNQKVLKQDLRRIYNHNSHTAALKYFSCLLNTLRKTISPIIHFLKNFKSPRWLKCLVCSAPKTDTYFGRTKEAPGSEPKTPLAASI